jgi:hypothetical protein
MPQLNALEHEAVTTTGRKASFSAECELSRLIGFVAARELHGMKHAFGGKQKVISETV